MTDQTSGAPPSEGAPSLLFNGALSTLNAIGSVWLFALVILINADAMGRTFFHAPINGVGEMIELSLVGIVFLQLADATRKGRLTRSDGCFKLLSVKFPSTSRALGIFFEFCGIVFMAVIIYGSVPLLLESIEGGYYVGNKGIFTAPVWPVKLVIIIGCLATLLQFFVFMMRFVRDGSECKTDMEISGKRDGT
ncbi:MAG: TRAP transporter small permease [Rhodospirillales bacterium]|nr:TRAP transporter small permease [Rhodospirillales bacterium]